MRGGTWAAAVAALVAMAAPPTTAQTAPAVLRATDCATNLMPAPLFVSGPFYGRGRGRPTPRRRRCGVGMPRQSRSRRARIRAARRSR